jgi:uncharacterized protein
MEDLMGSSEKEFQELAEKYNNFRIPSYEILIDNENLTKNTLMISNIQVVQSSKEAGMAIITIDDYYDYESGYFKNGIKSKLKLGSKIEVFLGYAGKNQMIFSGYIDTISYKITEVRSITLACMDGIHLLMENYTIEQKGNEKSLSTLVKEMLDKKRSFISESEVDDISEIGIQIAQNVNDYEFISGAAKEIGFEFFILAGKAYFRRRKKIYEPITTLSLGESIISFNADIKYTNVNVTATAKDDDNKKVFKGTAQGKTNTYNIKSIFVSNKTVNGVYINSDYAASIRAKLEVDYLLESAYTAKLECIGMPDIVPGRYIKIDGIDLDLKSIYYITKVTHQFSAGQYTASLDLNTGY